MKNESVKICRNCIHNEPSMNFHYDRCLINAKSEINVVNGQRSFFGVEYCFSSRTDPKGCGPSGRYFSDKREKTKWNWFRKLLGSGE